MLRVLSPVAGRVLAVSDIPDPVFAAGLVGPGSAIRPRPGEQTAVAPIDGILLKLHPHAYLVRGDDGVGVLVHLGIDTVRMYGDGFEPVASEGQSVTAGDPVVRWDPSYVEGTGRSAICAAVVLDCDPAVIANRSENGDVEPGDLLFEVDC